MEGRNFWCSLVVLVVVLASSGSVLEKAAAQETSSVEEGATLDVLYLSEACLGLEEECEQTRPDHFIEYFGADWCEPCKVLDNDIDVINMTDVFVMRHHPSPLDISYNTHPEFYIWFIITVESQCSSLNLEQLDSVL